MKRGASGLSLLVGVDKPAGLSSHDVVSRCRRIFGEKRVGHAGTLDPMATGVLPILVGTAARLNQYLSGHDKRYEATITFGCATDTDDAQGSPIRTSPVPREVSDAGFAESVLARYTGHLKQIPPLYSALKRDGKKACDEARRGNIVQVEPREVQVHAARLLSIDEGEGAVRWQVLFHVSKGTYIRSLARDIGNACGSAAHLSALRRTTAGAIGLEDCVTLETLERLGAAAALDPVPVLGFPIAFADERAQARVANGGPLARAGLQLHAYPAIPYAQRACSCTSGLTRVCEEPADGSPVSVACADELLAVYRVCAARDALVPSCVFSGGVSRGRGL